MKKRKKKYIQRIIGVAVIVFVTMNGLLIFFDQDSKVDRNSYVKEWTEAFTFDLYERLHTNGVFASTESNVVYFDDDIGAFQQFLVEEGATVNEGDPLYTYEVTNYEKEVADLEAQAERYESEITAIQSYLTEIERFRIPSPILNFDDEDEEQNDPPSYVETEFSQQEQIAEKEMELAQKEAMLEMVETQLTTLEEEGQLITVESPYSGVVTEVSQDLSSPLITMKTTTLHIEGEFSEAERKEVEPDMEVEYTVDDIDQTFTGALDSIRDFPDQASVNQASHYPFTVATSGEEDKILPGYHADLDVITDKAENATAAFDDVLLTEDNLFAWVMTDTGEMEYRAIETGLEIDGIVEVQNGLTVGEWLADYPRDEFRDGTVFITPIQQDDLLLEKLLDSNKVVIKNHLLLGLLGR
ncbi:efflux RND transporter periplasmic adaptor subunit [Thalassobacillus hwangdonensis]|uniref:Efflux RND transporter periplasmic adaptor subunit n=1 Tax=Thalassobacillus hwangdonensis TaxID=546108 RepID=A0ABW3L3N4_9BACI